MQWLDDLVKKVKEEFYNKTKWLHIGEYIADYLVNLAINFAEKIGQPELAKKIESKRENILEFGRSIDNKFGWKSVGDKDGNAKVAIFDEGMKTDCQFRDALHSVDVFSKDALRDEIKKQKGEEQKLVGQYALSKTKCAINLNKKSYEVNNDENIVDKKNKFEKRVEDKNKINPCLNDFNREME